MFADGSLWYEVLIVDTEKGCPTIAKVLREVSLPRPNELSIVPVAR